jgi:hypothetical protein
MFIFLFLGLLTIGSILHLIFEYCFHACPKCSTRPIKLIIPLNSIEMLIYFCPECQAPIEYKKL